ncbi:MAG: histidine kinase [Gammaproteobacteria bacterium]|nr:histidine kinase [Gammaproteobacteria bacterium]MBV9726486.1 histidine kinase [Gammaproteobacteria bacterium]
MSVSPLERVAPAAAALGRRTSAAAGEGVRAAPAGFRPLLGLLTAFWIYVALSNVMYANSMQASLSVQNIHHVFAPWDARVIQHLLLYPLFILSMRGALRTGWQPLWRALPLQLLCALGFAVLASPALVLGEYLTGMAHGSSMMHDSMQKEWGSWSGFVTHEVPIWLASITSFLVTYGFGLALVTGFAFYQRLRDSQLRTAALERALTQAHLTALRMQLSPHTLFNLLHTIRGQITWDPPAAQAMVVQLGDLLRRLLSAGEREFTRLTDELQFVTLYLELQQKRFADRLTIRVPLREDVPRAWVPSLILQPLVENAVVHGLAGHEGPVMIRVEAEASGERLVLRVVNTIAAGRAAGLAGIGLANVRERLEVQFGAAAAFSACPADENLWVAEIQMPLLRDGPAAPARAEGAASS